MKFFSKTKEVWEAPVSEALRETRFFENSLVRSLLIGNGFFLLGSIVALLFFIQPREAPIVLHYNVYFGVDLLGVWWQAYVLPLIGIVLLLGHVFLAYSFYKERERVAAYLLLLAMGFMSVGVAIASASIAFINY
ncbi:MAG: hypothetical protein A2808_01340 [Candidatus Moranbacteria bacterium RIFCSPHIGHO2_01_FULL_55_24]|nr:MAG: hypothetical protein A2808_01340 [Candidatus Moranbacteria bacterium RIFCSPHIGHO2_01_FULL_55_24]